MSEEKIEEIETVEETMVITDPDADRYHTFGYISWWQQEVVSNATVLVVGAGAIGNEVLKNLALMGIGNIIIADFDTIEDSNLSRSVLFRAGDNGKRKVDVAARAVKELNPDVKVKTFHGDINHGVGLGVFRHVDVVIGCLDNREARLSIDRFCQMVDRPWVDGAIQELMGIVRVFWGGRGATYESILTDTDYMIIGLRASCNVLARANVLQGKVPTTPTSASIVGAMEAQEALKLLHGMEVAPGTGIFINGLTNDVYKSQYPPVEERTIPALEPIIECMQLSVDSTVAEVLAVAREHVGADASLEFLHELVTHVTNPLTGETAELFKRMPSLTEDDMLVDAETDAHADMTLTNKVIGDEAWLHRTVAEIDQVPLTIFSASGEKGTVYLELTGDKEGYFQFE